MLSKDLNAIVAVVMVAGIIFVVANILVDILVGYLDPRIRFRLRARNEKNDDDSRDNGAKKQLRSTGDTGTNSEETNFPL